MHVRTDHFLIHRDMQDYRFFHAKSLVALLYETREVGVDEKMNCFTGFTSVAHELAKDFSIERWIWKEKDFSFSCLFLHCSNWSVVVNCPVFHELPEYLQMKCPSSEGHKPVLELVEQEQEKWLKRCQSNEEPVVEPVVETVVVPDFLQALLGTICLEKKLCVIH